jgi:hypothetical protein
MFLLNSSSRWSVAVLILFFFLWIWTEIIEYQARDNFTKEVNEFMHKGDRFTKQRGVELESRLTLLEVEVELLLEPTASGRELQAQIRELEDQLMELQGEQRWVP